VSKPISARLYIDILNQLGGKATLAEMYNHGIETGVMSMPPQDFKTTIGTLLKAGKLMGSLTKEIWPPLSDRTTVLQTKTNFDGLVRRVNTQGATLALLDAKFDERMSEFFGRLDAIEQRLNDLEMKQRLNLPF
jgi:hypothetical protein